MPETLNIYETAYMLRAVRELTPEPNFFKSRYFPTVEELDVFPTSTVFFDLERDSQKAAPFVLPGIGAIPVSRDGFDTYNLAPARIAVSRELTEDHLQGRSFGESILSTRLPEQRARMLLMGDLDYLQRMITRTEERLACDTMMNNGTVMRHITDKPEVYKDVTVRFYQGENNPARFTPAAAWEHGTENKAGNWYSDIVSAIKMLTHKGKRAEDLILSWDVAEFMLTDPWVDKMMNTRHSVYGVMAPDQIAPFVTSLGRFNFGGRWLNIFVNDGMYTDDTGVNRPYLDEGTFIVTAPACGKGLYGAETQKEMDNQWHTRTGTRIPNMISTVKPAMDEVILASRPLFVPTEANPWISGVKVFD